MRDLCKMQIHHYTNIESMAMILNSKNIRFRAKIKELAEGWGQIVPPPLAYRTAGGKQKNNFADMQGIFRIIQSVPSKKAEPVKQWLAQLGQQRITA